MRPSQLLEPILVVPEKGAKIFKNPHKIGYFRCIFMKMRYDFLQDFPSFSLESLQNEAGNEPHSGSPKPVSSGCRSKKSSIRCIPW
jgi:hypothetical protein